jgi:anaphase-promoting complex subunit 3
VTFGISYFFDAIITLAMPLSRESHVVPDEAILQCRAGAFAVKARLTQKAIASFTRALTLNPLLWEAFEGLCSIGES